MSREKVKPLGGNQAAGDEETGPDAVSTYHYTPENETCQVLALADSCLERCNFHRAQYAITGDVAHFRAALALAQDRETLLGGLRRAHDETGQ